MDNKQPTSQVKFDLKFIDEIYRYIEIYKKQQKRPSVEGFANRIETTKESVLAWADKKKKDENGNLTDEWARPKFREAIALLQELENVPEVETVNPKQELFCKLYASDREFFGNGVQSYIEAYEPDQSKPNWYNSARASASQLLSNINVCRRITELLEDGGLNDMNVDKQLSLVIYQNADFSSKVAAIREYNKLKTRIIDRIDHTTKGKEFPTPIYNGKSEPV